MPTVIDREPIQDKARRATQELSKLAPVWHRARPSAGRRKRRVCNSNARVRSATRCSRAGNGALQLRGHVLNEIRQTPKPRLPGAGRAAENCPAGQLFSGAREIGDGLW